jgi:gamma-glutamyltranspeptidase / glutathione hydrolase
VNVSRQKMKTFYSVMLWMILCSAYLFAEETSPAKEQHSGSGYWQSESRSREVLIKNIEAKKGTMGVAPHAMVASCHPEATKIGLKILKDGGSAVDAFIAVTFAEYVLAPGTTSMAGPINMLIYDASSKKVHNLSAGLKTVESTSGLWTNATDPIGKSVLVPGAIAGLEASHKKFGKLSWKVLVEPAIKIAEDGFSIPASYEAILKSRQTIIEKSDYGKKMFFLDGKLLKLGDVLKQPEVAQVLKQIAEIGSQFFYKGEWGREMVGRIKELGGALSLRDLEKYSPQWIQPLSTEYRGYEIFVPGPPNIGGIKVLLSLKILENLDIHQMGHWSENADALASMIRISRAVSSETWFFGSQLEDIKFVKAHLSREYGKSILEKIKKESSNTIKSASGTHSYHVIVIDKDGNIANGTHTIESFPWGDHGIFIKGVPLNSAGLQSLGEASGHFLKDPFTIQIVMRDQRPILASGFFSASMFPADFQVLSNVLDFQMSPEDALLKPRFGSFAYDLSATPPRIDPFRTVLDKRFSEQMVQSLRKKGVESETNGYIDTGMGVLIQIDQEKRLLKGMTPEQLEGLAEGF